MSKSRGNVVDPDAEVAKYGADTIRMNFAFLGPFEQDYAWNSNNISGISRFLDRVWNLFQKVESSKQQVVREENEELNIIVNKTIKKIGEDIENLKFNTGVSELMKLLNEFESKKSSLLTTHYSLLAKLLAPFAPHIAEELWREVLGNKSSIHLERWPKYDKTLLEKETVTIAIQVNGKIRDTVEAKKGVVEGELKKLVLAREKVKKYLEGKEIKKFIYIQDRLTNIVI
jgi:leucyl-tRNA synthetase